MLERYAVGIVASARRVNYQARAQSADWQRDPDKDTD